jgi:uncharacterized protein (DUF427 family)
MTEKLVLQPDESHPITIERSPERIVVTVGGRTIADTQAALTLREADYPPVHYIPLADVERSLLEPTDHSSYCPYKGDANYYTILMNGRFAENAVWTYEHPYPAMESIRDRLAFYPNQVEIYEVGDADDAAAVKEAVLHTDDGAGSSQKEPWAPTVGEPG